MLVDLFKRKQTHFVLWRVASGGDVPSLYIGEVGGSFEEILLRQSPEFAELWEVAALECGLVEGRVYHYWFKVRSSCPYGHREVVYCTDPVAYAVNRQVLSPGGGDPASVILYRGGLLVACDPQGQIVKQVEGREIKHLPANNRLVIYELPVRWTKAGEKAIGVGTFRDVRSLLSGDSAHLVKLGINALELLPPADSDDRSEWGYGTANFFAADFDLGVSENGETLAASTDLVDLVEDCRQQGIRFFLDMVMAFARNNAFAAYQF